VAKVDKRKNKQYDGLDVKTRIASRKKNFWGSGEKRYTAQREHGR